MSFNLRRDVYLSSLFVRLPHTLVLFRLKHEFRRLKSIQKGNTKRRITVAVYKFALFNYSLHLRLPET